MTLGASPKRSLLDDSPAVATFTTQLAKECSDLFNHLCLQIV
jgi:hypothetical protein